MTAYERYESALDAAVKAATPTQQGIKVGVLVRWSSLWIGAHWSPFNRRLCVNLIPCVTVWLTLSGGNTP